MCPSIVLSAKPFSPQRLLIASPFRARPPCYSRNETVSSNTDRGKKPFVPKLLTSTPSLIKRADNVLALDKGIGIDYPSDSIKLLIRYLL